MSRSTHALRLRAAGRLVAAAALLLGALAPSGTADARAGSPSADAGDDLDVLRSTDAELQARIVEYGRQREATAAALAGADAAAAEARRQAEIARESEARARRAAEKADEEVRRIAVRAYVGESELNELAVFAASDPAEANRVSMYLRHEAERRKETFDAQRRAHSRLRRASATSERAATAFDDAAADRRRLLSELDAAREDQLLFAAAVEDRIEAKLAEVEALAEIDAVIAAEVAAQAASLQAANRGEPVPPAPAAAPAEPGPAPPAPPGPAPTLPRPPAPPTTARPTTPVAPTTTAPPSKPAVTVTRVGPFVVATSIAANVRAMLDEATFSGYSLGGSGYRDTQQQIALRTAHCGPTYYDIWEKPSSQCSPPTARPGRSMHELGLALDITCSGSLIRSRSSPCFLWLAANAARFGLYNLPSEPWHWSTTGT